jgi:hypothetical protein
MKCRRRSSPTPRKKRIPWKESLFFDFSMLTLFYLDRGCYGRPFSYTFSTFDVMKQNFSTQKNTCARADLCKLVLKEKKRIHAKTLFELQLLDRVTLYPLPEDIFVIYYLKADVGAERPRCNCEGYFM